MSKNTEVQDYFFIAESGEMSVDHTEIFASGEGKETLRALMRASLLGIALREKPHSSLFDSFFDKEGYGYIGGRDCYIHDDIVTENDEPVVVCGSMWDICEILSQSHEDYRKARKHREAVLNQLSDGARSAQSVMDEFMQLDRDQPLIHTAGHHIYDRQGRQLTLPGYNVKYNPNTGLSLALSTITRHQVTDEEERRIKDILFGNIPEGAIGKVVTTAAGLNRRKDDSINSDNPVKPAGFSTSKLYGYEKGTEFVPVYDRESDQLLV